MAEKQPEPRYLAVGRILRPHGVRGELRAEILTDYPEHIADLQTLYVGKDHRPHVLLGVRFPQGAMLLTLEGCTTRDDAEMLRGSLVEIAITDAVPLDEEEYYHFQVVGMQVATDAGDVLGRIVDVFTVPGANDVFVVHGTQGEILIPVIEDVVIDLDVEARRVLIHMLPGLLGEE
jgi:16S rRNA processing protein RimM